MYVKEGCNVPKIRVDIEELSAKLEDMLADDFVTVELDIDTVRASELRLTAIGIDEDERVNYGEVEATSSELF